MLDLSASAGHKKPGIAQFFRSTSALRGALGTLARVVETDELTRRVEALEAHKWPWTPECAASRVAAWVAFYARCPAQGKQCASRARNRATVLTTQMIGDEAPRVIRKVIELALAGIVETQRKVLETVNLAVRIEALEAGRGQKARSAPAQA